MPLKLSYFISSLGSGLGGASVAASAGPLEGGLLLGGNQKKEDESLNFDP